jgi:LysM repeat protein
VYRRRRLAVLFAVLSILALPALFVAAGGASTTVTPASAPAAAPARTVYVVQPGDTLWSIARSVDPTGDPREVVDRLVDLNGGSALQPGQRLRLTDN